MQDNDRKEKAQNRIRARLMWETEWETECVKYGNTWVAPEFHTQVIFTQSRFSSSSALGRAGQTPDPPGGSKGGEGKGSLAGGGLHTFSVSNRTECKSLGAACKTKWVLSHCTFLTSQENVVFFSANTLCPLTSAPCILSAYQTAHGYLYKAEGKTVITSMAGGHLM